MNLIEILNKKCLTYPNIFNTNKEISHGYLSNFYQKTFEKYTNNPIILVEVGVLSGGSLALWHEFFHKKSKIIGIDIYFDFPIKYELLNKRYPRIKLFEANGYQYDIFEKIPNFDIAIDDGSHLFEDQCKFITLYSKFVNKNGVLVIEDISNVNYIDEFIKLVPKNMKYEIHDLRFKHRSYHKDSIIFSIHNE